MNTRIAPSPTGDMHIGTARTAYFNWLAARASGGKFMLRIDDTDPERSKPEYTQVILDTMAWLGLDYDQLVYQSQRLDRYKSLANELIAQGFAKRIATGAIALNPRRFPDSFVDDLAGKIEISEDDRNHMTPGYTFVREGSADGIILMRSPKIGSNEMFPTYHWACVVDDMDFGIDYIIRGVDHLTNTSRHVTIYSVLGGVVPRYAHIGLIHMGGKKLSKREGAASMLYYRDKGYDPDAVLNFMARLGWGPKVDDKTTAILPKEKMLELFLDGGTMKSSPANMDLQKLDSFDRKYKGRKKNAGQSNNSPHG